MLNAVGLEALVDPKHPDAALLAYLPTTPTRWKAAGQPQAAENPHCPQRQAGHRGLLPRGVGEVGVRQTAHLSLQEPRGPTDLRTRP